MERYNFEQEIEKYRKLYSSYSRAKLIAEMAQWKTSSDQHIAAKQLLDQIDTKDSSNQHTETLKFAKRANRWAFWAFIIGLLSFLALVAFWTYDHFQSLNGMKQKTEKVIIKPESSPVPKDISLPSLIPTEQTHKSPLPSVPKEK